MAKRCIFLLCSLMLVLLGCSKDDPEPVATFEFQINNGPVIEWNGQGSGTTVCLLCGPNLHKQPTYFILLSSAPDDYGRALSFTFTSSEINLATYTETVEQSPEFDYLAPHRLYMDPIRGAATEEGDFATVTFTNIQEGKYYDGIFQARITAFPYGPEAEKLEIEGEFKNVLLFL